MLRTARQGRKNVALVALIMGFPFQFDEFKRLQLDLRARPEALKFLLDFKEPW
jgi:hypothetical protein